MWLWALLPLSFSIIGTAGLWTVCAVAVMNGSVNLTNGVPYISSCASERPQSCLFAQTCNIIAVLAMMIATIRFHQVKDYGYHGKANAASVYFGFISSIALSVSSNFECTVAYEVHLLAAIITFLCGLIYFWIQLYITYQCLPYKDQKWVGSVRAICCVFCTITGFGMVLKPEYGATVCEWIFVMLMFFLYGLFVTEFRHIECCNLIVRMMTLKNDDCTHVVVQKNQYALNAPS